jgi:hypothetical protein
MAYVFLHTADWHLAKPFGALPAEKAAVLRQARLTVIDRLAAAARAAGARDVLVAGDTFDAEDLALRTLREGVGRLGGHGDLCWHLLPGNHDADRPGGLWDRLAKDGLPANVIALRAAAPRDLAPGVVLLPAPLRARAASEDPTRWMVGAATAPGTLRIGLAHGAVRGFGGGAAPAVAIDPARASSAGLAYLALGDWHGTAEVGPRAWYAGTPEPDQYPANDPGHALVVRLGGAGGGLEVERIATAAFAWERRALVLDAPADLAGLEAELAGAGAGSRLLKLELSGRVSRAAEAEVAHRLERLAPLVFWLEADLDGLEVVAEAGDEALLGEGELARAAAALARRAAGEGQQAEAGQRAAAGEAARIAGLALRRLHVLARAAAGGAE